MKFYKNLYVTELVKDRKENIIQKLQNGEFPLACYLLVLLETGESQLEFYSTTLLHQKQLQDDSIFIVGLAAGYRDAIRLVQKVTQEVYEKTGGADIRTYIRNKENE